MMPGELLNSSETLCSLPKKRKLSQERKELESTNRESNVNKESPNSLPHCSSNKLTTEEVNGCVRDVGSDESASMNDNTNEKSGSENSPSRGHTSYKDLSLIGDGAYGTVYKAKDYTNGEFVALKKVRVPITEDGLPISTLREIATLKQLERFENPYIVRTKTVAAILYCVTHLLNRLKQLI